ncbi:MAG: phospholipase A [Desulfobacterales bacterium]
MKTITTLMILLSAMPAAAVGVETLIAPMAEPMQAGQKTTIGIYIHNTGKENVVVDLPDRLTCFIKSETKTAQVAAYPETSLPGPSATIVPMGFLKVRYVFLVPDGFDGPVRLEIPSFEGASLLVASIEAPSPPEAKETAKTSENESETLPTLEDIQMLYQPYLVNLGAYNPMYFLVGTNPENSKFQVSFKYRFFKPENTLAERLPWVSGLHFAYTQTSFWDLRSDSQPFEDTSYKPEFFLVSPNIKTPIPGNRGFFLQGGFQHESNGRGGDLSRSTNFLYLKPMFIFYDTKSKFGLYAAPKVWAYVANADDTNPDLSDYRGYFDLELKFGKADSFVLNSYLGWAKEGGSLQLDLTYPLDRLFSSNFDLYFQAQYVNALAESLLDYRQRTRAFRLGFAIVR